MRAPSTQDGVFTASGTFGTEHPIGTGPFQFDSWTRNDRLVLKKYEDYWGEKSKIDELIVRPIADNAARLQALQTGEIQGYDLVEPQDIADDRGRRDLQIIDRPAFNVAYVGFNIAEPTDDVKVREAIAYAADRYVPAWPPAVVASVTSLFSSSAWRRHWCDA